MDKARFSAVLSVVKNIKNAQELYYLANGQYGADFSELDVDLPLGGTSITASVMLYPNGMDFHFQVMRDGTAASVCGF